MKMMNSDLRLNIHLIGRKLPKIKYNDMSILLLLSSAILLAIISVIGVNSAASSPNTYTDPLGFFTLQYPPGWIIEPMKSGSVMFRAPQETFSDVYDINAAVTVSVNGLPSLTNSLQDLTDYKLKITAPMGAEQTIIESKNTTLSGKPAHMTVKEQKYQYAGIVDIGMGDEQKLMEIWTINNDKWYDITYMAPIDKYESYLPIIQPMINSFHI